LRFQCVKRKCRSRHDAAALTRNPKHYRIGHSYGDPDANTADGKPATRLTFGEKVRALELQGRALAFLKEQLEVRGTEVAPIRIVHQQLEG
jgi:hypothetical protein